MKTFFGGLLQAVGFIIAAASGLCSLFVIFSGVSNIRSSEHLLTNFYLVALFGGIPFVIGLGLWHAGRIVRGVQEDVPAAQEPWLVEKPLEKPIEKSRKDISDDDY